MTEYKRELLPGKSAYDLAGGLFISMVVTLSLLLVGVATNVWGRNLMGPSIGSIVFGIVVSLFVLSLLTTSILTAVVSSRTRNERAAGYTTSPSGSLDLDLVDPASGTIVRPAGGAPVSRATYVAACRAIRERKEQSEVA